MADWLVDDGKILWDNLRRSRISEHDLVEALRLQVEDPAQIRVTYKERNGEISAIPRKRPFQLVQLGIVNGVQQVRLEISS